jgi:hypothetical protein
MDLLLLDQLDTKLLEGERAWEPAPSQTSSSE